MLGLALVAIGLFVADGTGAGAALARCRRAAAPARRRADRAVRRADAGPHDRLARRPVRRHPRAHRPRERRAQPVPHGRHGRGADDRHLPGQLRGGVRGRAEEEHHRRAVDRPEGAAVRVELRRRRRQRAAAAGARQTRSPPCPASPPSRRPASSRRRCVPARLRHPGLVRRARVRRRLPAALDRRLRRRHPRADARRRASSTRTPRRTTTSTSARRSRVENRNGTKGTFESPASSRSRNLVSGLLTSPEGLAPLADTRASRSCSWSPTRRPTSARCRQQVQKVARGVEPARRRAVEPGGDRSASPGRSTPSSTRSTRCSR